MASSYKKTITVLGAGYVGLTTAALLSNAGYKVYAVEPDKTRLEIIKSGKSFFFESGLDKLIASALSDGLLIPTDDYLKAIPDSDIIFSCVGTPENKDGSLNLSHVFEAAREALSLCKDEVVYVQKSTVPVGTGHKIVDLFSASHKSVGYVSNPEFLREGTSIVDSLYFDRIVLGGESMVAIQKVENIYKGLEDKRDHIASKSGVKRVNRKGLYFRTGLQSAELIKVTANAFLSLKISFANSIAKLSDAVGADIVEVMDAVGSDGRIGRDFLNAGRGYGGGCFPKDVDGLIASGKEHGVSLTIMEASQKINSSMPLYVVSKTLSNLPVHLPHEQTITVLGLSFKAGTSDTRKSPGIQIANIFSNKGYVVKVYDPQANEEALEYLSKEVLIGFSIDDALIGADACIVATDWPEFIGEELLDSIKKSSLTLCVDAVNKLVSADVKAAGARYIGIGRF